jgi:hypothetical protein
MTTILCYNAGIFQQRKGQQYSAIVLVYFSKEKDNKTLLQCWYISTKKRIARLCYNAGIYQYKKAAYQDNKYLVIVMMHDNKKGQFDGRKRTRSIL